MKFEEIKRRFVLMSSKPTMKDFKKYDAFLAPKFEYKGVTYWAMIRSNRDYQIFYFLQDPKDYKVKERMFGADLDEGYIYSSQRSNSQPESIDIVLPKKWGINEGDFTRELEVIVTNDDQNNDPLLHRLYTRTRE